MLANALGEGRERGILREASSGEAATSTDGLGDHCLICGKPVANYEPEMCCSGDECTCRGEPMNPCTCSAECETALFDGIGKSYDQRRIDAGIRIWTPNYK